MSIQKLKYDVYIFDFDGTLVQSNEIKRDTFFTVTSQFNNSQNIIQSIIKSNPSFSRYEIFNKFVIELPNKVNKIYLANKLTEKYSAICEGQIASAPEVPYTL